MKSRCAGRGCLYCAGRLLLKGFNDLRTTNPSILQEWDNEKDTNINPEDLQAGSHKKVWRINAEVKAVVNESFCSQD